MRYLNKELVVFLIGIRWIGLFLGVISYIKNYDGTIYMMIPLAIINIIYTVNVNSNTPQYQAFTIVFFDIFFNLILSYQTSGFNSPFFIYSLTTFIWLLFHANVPAVIVATIWYGVMSFGMEFYVRPELWPVQLSKLIWEVQILLLIVMFLFILSHYGKTVVTIYRDIYLIQRVARLTIKLDIREITDRLESLLNQLFMVEKAIICWITPHGPKVDWQHNHYIYLLNKEKSISKKRLEYHKLQDVDGQLKNIVTFPVKDDKGGVIAYILLVNEQPLTIKRFSLLYLHLITFVLYHRYQIIRQTEVIQESMRQEVRTKLAQDMHDGLAQQLFFLNAKIFQLKMLTKKYDDEELGNIIENIGLQVEDSHQEVRNHIESLRNIYKETNMSYAIEKLVEKMTRGLSIKVKLNYDAGVKQESVEIEETIYRFVEEAMNNVLKHSFATNVNIHIQCNPREWVIVIQDNGIGMDSVDSIKKGRFGVRGMKERIEKLEGNVYFESEINKGTSVMATIPRRRKQDD